MHKVLLSTHIFTGSEKSAILKPATKTTTTPRTTPKPTPKPTQTPTQKPTQKPDCPVITAGRGQVSVSVEEKCFVFDISNYRDKEDAEEYCKG